MLWCQMQVDPGWPSVAEQYLALQLETPLHFVVCMVWTRKLEDMRMQDSPGYFVNGDEVYAIMSYVRKGNEEYLAADLVRPLSSALLTPVTGNLVPACNICRRCSPDSIISNIACKHRAWLSFTRQRTSSRMSLAAATAE